MSPLRKRLLLVAIVAAIAVAAIFYYRQSQQIEVETMVVKRGDLVITVTPTETGTVDTDATALVKAEIAAQIKEVAVAEGDVVKAGDLLMRLDADDVQAKVTLARANLEAAGARLASARIALPMEKARTAAAVAQARARFEDAKQKYDKRKQLYERRLIPLGEMESSAADLDAARAALDQAQANLEQVPVQERQVKVAQADVEQQAAQLRVAQLNLDRATIRAPVGGTVMEVPVKAGELVQPGTPVARITRMEGLYIKALVDEVDLSRLVLGQPAEITFDTLPDKKFAATLFEISPGVSVEKLKSRNVTVKLKLTAPPAFLRPGMSADVEVIVDRVKDVPYVPAQTVMSRDKEQFVYVLEDGRIAKRVIEAGRSNWDYIEIRKGLREGEQVITSLDVEGLKPDVRARRKE
ncbi:MAG: efflux RND transporter periplasmic adaptor subunit [Gammaproteobacteria bacterium]|nr:efflux RND transporter periplasmic adaptor subunit [Gammaproteobacteria bacterium]